MQNLALLPNAIDPHHLLSSFGLLGLLIIIFAECGLLVGFFLPGDTLLFSAGLLIATGASTCRSGCSDAVPIAAIVGNLVGYWIGYKAGPAVFGGPTPGCSGRSTSTARTTSSTGTAPARSCWPGSSRSCARSPP